MNKLRFKVNFSSLILLLLISTTNSFSQADLIKIYEQKIATFDTAVYFNIQMQTTKHLTGGLSSIAISTSLYYQNEKVSTFIDTNRTFHKNGNLKHMQIQDSLGLVCEIYQYDKTGNISRHCQLSRDFLSDKADSYADLKVSYMNYCKKYKNGKLIFEGKFIGEKIEDGKHIWYNDDGTIEKEVIYDKGMVINNTQQ
jgi:antitoxin component YwqK of YwqJK toxin-antitoxin module